MAQTVKNLPAMRETWVRSLGQEVSLAFPTCPNSHTRRRWSYLNILSCHNKQVSGLSRLAKGQSSNRIAALVQNLGLAMSVPSDVPFVQCNTAICETCRRAGNSI